MDLLGATTLTGGAVLALVLAFMLFQPTGLVNWLQKKNYQYEVTFSLYMLTPTEKFVFSMTSCSSLTIALQLIGHPDSVLFLTLSMFTIASILYLPDHVCTISRRAYYYFAGDAVLKDASRTAASQIGGTASKASEAVLGAATEIAGALHQAAVNTATAAQEAVNQAAEGLGWG